jgi:hypothetical protein
VATRRRHTIDSKGLLEATSRIIEALQSAGIYQNVPIRKVSVLSPNDNLAKTLEQEIKGRTEGAIHIVGHDQSKPNHEKVYSVIFAPFAGPGGAVPARHFTALEELRKFLEKRLRIRKTSVEEALAELARKGSTSNIQRTAHKPRGQEA